MAVLLKKLEDQLSCPICLDILIAPKQLQCHHVYCQQCLDRMVGQDQQGQLTLTCPNCRQVTPVPASGAAGLQPAFLVSQLLEIVEEHKKVTAATVKVESASESTTSNFICPEHNGKEMALYCETCGELICWECIMKGSKHHSHKYKKLNEAFNKYREEITSSLELLEKQLTIIEGAHVGGLYCVGDDRVQFSSFLSISVVDSGLYVILECRNDHYMLQEDLNSYFSFHDIKTLQMSPSLSQEYMAMESCSLVAL